jgi:corrinoid protein of di/trimethylamine methyltransferase
MGKEQILNGLEKSVVAGRKDEAKKLANEALSHGISPMEAIDFGMIKGMNIVGDKYAAHEYFLPQVLLAADAMMGALEILLPHIPEGQLSKQVKGCIGVVEGDIHDIGKRIAFAMMNASGFAILDLGRDVPVEKFLSTARINGGGIVAMSTLMTTTLDVMKYVVDGLSKSGIRSKCIIVIGGAPTSRDFVEEIGADIYAMTAQDGVAKIKRAIGSA